MIIEVLHDKYWWKLPNGKLVEKSRHEDIRWPWADYDYPAVVELTSNPKSGNANVRINDAWMLYVMAINTPSAWQKLRTVAQGWINSASNREYKSGYIVDYNANAVIEAMTCVGNRHMVKSRKNGSYELECFLLKDWPPDPKKVNPKTYPHLFVKMTGISKEGVVRPALNNAYVPLLAKKSLWIDGRKAKVVK